VTTLAHDHIEALFHFLSDTDDELIARLGMRGVDRVGGQFQDAFGLRLDRSNAERPKVLDQMDDPIIFVEINDVDREKEPERMDAPRGHNPDSLVGPETEPADEAAKARKYGIRSLDIEAKEAFTRRVIYAVGSPLHSFTGPDGPSSPSSDLNASQN
jgi:hypothetical protein